ncbi:MAG: hypothetical protein ACYCPN_04200 [Thermoplasmata archaeon]
MNRKHRGSGKWHKPRIRLARCHAKIRDQRWDFAHPTTTGWVRGHDLVAFEDMDLCQHRQGRFPKALADAGWGLLRQISKHKGDRRSGRYC